MIDQDEVLFQVTLGDVLDVNDGGFGVPGSVIVESVRRFRKSLEFCNEDVIDAIQYVLGELHNERKAV